MKWIVVGKWADGTDAELPVETPSKLHAEAIAAKRGISVVSSRLADDSPHAPIAYESPRSDAPHARGSYRLFTAACSLMIGLGSLAIVLAAVFAIAAIGRGASTASAFVAAAVMGGNGVLLLFLGFSGEILREIAFNTRR